MEPGPPKAIGEDPVVLYPRTEVPEIRNYASPGRADLVTLGIGRGRWKLGWCVVRFDGRKVQSWWRLTKVGAIEVFEAQHDQLLAQGMKWKR